MSCLTTRYQYHDVMEYLSDLYLYWYDREDAKAKLELLAKHIDEPIKLKELEEEWLYAGKSRTNDTNPTRGEEWDHWGNPDDPSCFRWPPSENYRY